jgi:hypothetical protein
MKQLHVQLVILDDKDLLGHSKPELGAAFRDERLLAAASLKLIPRYP